MNNFYDGTKLLSLQDINKKKPEIFIATSNRSAGKTTFFNKMVTKRFIREERKFMLLYRYKYELEDVGNKFFKDIKSLFFPNYNISYSLKAKGNYGELSLKGKPCGYAVALNSAEQIKKLSHFFSDTDSIIFDEFQSENNNYCDNEINKFRSIHMSVARGAGSQSRYVPVYMISNPISMINPYFSALKITSRLDDKTRFLRGKGWVLEQGYNNSASKALSDSAFNSAFEDEFNKYAIQGMYLDNRCLIMKPTGKSYYIATLNFKDKQLALRSFEDYLYISQNVDKNNGNIINFSFDNMGTGGIMYTQKSYIKISIQNAFETGSLYFDNLESKTTILNIF